MVNKAQKIEKHHLEEITLILLILSAELSKYDEEDLVSFTESIEGRVDVLFTRDFLLSINKRHGITDSIIADLEQLKDHVVKLYGPRWHKKLKEKNQQLSEVRLMTSKILNALKMEYVDPKEFSNKHLNIDW